MKLQIVKFEVVRPAKPAFPQKFAQILGFSSLHHLAENLLGLCTNSYLNKD